MVYGLDNAAMSTRSDEPHRYGERSGDHYLPGKCHVLPPLSFPQVQNKDHLQPIENQERSLAGK
jgi:hypothetical protein